LWAKNTVLNNGAAEWNWQNLNSILLLFEDLWNVAVVHERLQERIIPRSTTSAR
jgi:hypothetical protein